MTGYQGGTINNRRRLVIALGAGALATPFAAVAQQPGKVWRVGILPAGPLPARRHLWDVFRQRMHELGYAEGKNVRYEFRAPDKEGGAFDELAAELVRLNIDVIVASTNPPIAAAKRATQHIPIVMSPSTDPVGLGFVTSLRQPGGNLTGINVMFEETAGKRLQLLREMAPKTSRVALLWDAVGGKPQLEAAQTAARQLGVRLQSLEVNTEDALLAAFDAAIVGRADALMVASSGFTFGLRAQITALALKHRLPSIYPLESNAEAGGLMTYGPSQTGYYQQAAVFVDKIIKGAKPADLPVEQPTKFDLVINRKTAKALNLTIPQTLLISAQRVIE